MLASLMHGRWGMLGFFGFLGLMTALVAMTGMIQGLRRFFGWASEEEQSQEKKKTDTVQMLALGEVAEPREETSFGSPPQGPEVALDLNPNRYTADSSNDVDS